MSSIVALAGSPSAVSRTVALVGLFAEWLRADGHQVRVVSVRTLPAEALLGGDAAEPVVAEAVAAVAAADGVIVASPVYKAAYSGVLKTFLDVLPQGALTGKVALPLLTGGAQLHALTVDYALRPVLTALGARQVGTGLFVLDKQIERTPNGVVLASGVQAVVQAALDEFVSVLPATVGLRR